LLEQIDAHHRQIEDTGSLAERRARNLRAEVLGSPPPGPSPPGGTSGGDPEWEGC
jgi:hypothetical protein